MAGPRTLTRKLLERHLVAGDADPGSDLDLHIEQTLTQDATGTLVMLELEAMELDRVRTERSVQYVDHNLVQQDFRNPDDHRFLMAACERFGVVYSRPGNGVSHPLHMQHFGCPGASLLGSDSHTPAAGALGMLAIGAGGLDVALAMAGEPYRVRAPEVFGVELVGELPDWISAKDIILEMLRRHGVRGGVGCVLEYHGPGLRQLGTWDRHVIANMGTELGATTSVFPADDITREFLTRNGRPGDWERIEADAGCTYDRTDRIDLSALEPLIARPSSPGDVVPVREVEGEPIGQAYIGSSANPGFRDLAVAALMVEGRQTPSDVSFDINPSSRAVLVDLIRHGHLTRLLAAGARLHQAGCNGCIGMGQAPASDTNSLRTVPRNFPGRSGTTDDRVWLCGPETATASALRGRITDPRSLEQPYPRVAPLEHPTVQRGLFHAPSAAAAERDQSDRPVARSGPLPKGPNIAALPPFEPPPDSFELSVALAVGDDVSTDEIMPAGTRTLPLRSNIPEIAEHCFRDVDPEYPANARAAKGGHAIVAGANYGQGSSREHAAVAPRHLGLRAVLARSFARIHRANLVNFGVLPLLVRSDEDRARLAGAARICITDVRECLGAGEPVEVLVSRSGRSGRSDGDGDYDATVVVDHDLTEAELRTVLAGGKIREISERLREAAPAG